jgi:hypothetical protein
MFSSWTMSGLDTRWQPASNPWAAIFCPQAVSQPSYKIIGQISVAVKADARDTAESGNRADGAASRAVTMTDEGRNGAERARVKNVRKRGLGGGT